MSENYCGDNNNTSVHQQQIEQIIVPILFRSTLGLQSEACPSEYRLGNYWVRDTNIVEGFLSDGPNALSMSCEREIFQGYVLSGTYRPIPHKELL